jgi:hypothetical protein
MPEDQRILSFRRHSNRFTLFKLSVVIAGIGIRLAFLFAILWVARLQTASAALPQKDSADFSWKYEMDVSPDTDNQNGVPAGDFDYQNGPPWGLMAFDGTVNGDGTITTDGPGPFDRFTSHAGTAAHVWNDVSWESGYTIETRLKSAQAAGASYSFDLYSLIGPSATAQAWLSISDTGLAWSSATSIGGAMDNSNDFHEYRITRLPSSSVVHIWRDGTLVAGNLFAKNDITGDLFVAGSASAGTFGADTIDYLRITPGAFAPIGAAPIPDPDFGDQVLDFQQRQIYHSPETPGYTCWVALWRMPNGAIQSNFTQVVTDELTGDRLWNAPILQSTDSGGTWTIADPDLPATLALELAPDFYNNNVPNSRWGAWVSADGNTIVRPMRNLPGIDSGYTQRSTDGGETWDSPFYFMPLSQYRTLPTLIKPLSDGRLVLMAGVWDRDNVDPYLNTNLEKMMFISTDQGQSWGDPISLMPVSTGVCEESDFAELPNGDLMWIHRAEHFDGSTHTSTNRMKTISTKVGDTFVSQPASVLPFPHSGFPLVLMTQEGVILDLATTGSHWSDDLGETWQDLMVGSGPLRTSYYPRAIQTADGTIVVVGHAGGDDTYGGFDQSIIMQSFRLSPVNVPVLGDMNGDGIPTPKRCD